MSVLVDTMVAVCWGCSRADQIVTFTFMTEPDEEYRSIALNLKDQANAAYQAGEIQRAIELYTQVLFAIRK
jgi:hypothetical protein